MTSLSISLPHHSTSHHPHPLPPRTLHRLLAALVLVLAVVVALQAQPAPTDTLRVNPGQTTTSTLPGPPSAYDMLAGQAR